MEDLIVAFDLGMNLGYSVLNRKTGARVDSGTIKLAGRAGDHPGSRWERAKNAMLAILAKHDSTHQVVYEKVRRHAGATAAHCYGALEAALQMAAQQMSLTPEAIEVTTWKKLATGNGHANKILYTKVASQRYGLVLNVQKHEDEAAALGVGYAALVMLSFPKASVKKKAPHGRKKTP